ncbi:PKD domain-containing protein [Lacinutrix undariae]
MKKFKNILRICLLLLTVTACIKDDDNNNFVDNIEAPTNVSVNVTVTQDNTGLVTLIPLSEGGVNYEILFGDGTEEIAEVAPGFSATHIYEEGTYDITVIAYNLNGEATTITQSIIVSFEAPENLVVTIENDGTISKTVNVTATADYAMFYAITFGEDANTESTTVNIGETISYTYQEAGTYTISVEAMGAAIATTTYTEDFEVTAILQPLVHAPNQPARVATDVVSVFSAAYADVSGTDFYPNWGQATTYNQLDIDGDATIQYGGLTYQGIQIGETVNVSEMEFLHIDVWTADENIALDIFPISILSGEQAYQVTPTAQQWNSYNIPLSAFTDLGLSLDDIHQFKFVGTPDGEATVFLDNIYFYKEATGTITSIVQDFEGEVPTFTTFGNIADTQVVANPDATGANTTSNVAQLTKTAGAEVWAGTFFELSSTLDLTTYNKINVKTWSPIAGAVVKFKLENQDATITHEVDMSTTVANGWENILYDFSDAPVADYVRMVIFFDFGNVGDDSVYYYDEIELVNNDGGIAPLEFQNFEDAAPVFTTFGNIADVQVVANPDATGINTSANVAQLLKTAGSETWAGSFFETTPVLDFATYSKISVKTWSPIAGAVVKMKLENVDTSVEYEVDMSTTVANQWEEIVFDFNDAPTADYVRVVIFFDFGNAGDDSVYYYDEFTLQN